MLLRWTLKFSLSHKPGAWKAHDGTGTPLKQMPKQSFARRTAALMEHAPHQGASPAFQHPFAAPWWLTAGQVNEKDCNV
jgi:hypothetical protein